MNISYADNIPQQLFRSSVGPIKVSSVSNADNNCGAKALFREGPRYGVQRTYVVVVVLVRKAS
jgi:hypothetical protein